MTNKIDEVFAQDGHVIFAGQSVQLAFGRRQDGVVIHISQATRGAFDRCSCPNPACGRPLVAKKGSVLGHHFQHAPLSKKERAIGVAPTCAGAAMTALHAYAQTLLNERKSLTIPPVEAEVGGRKRRKSGSRTFEFDSARLEMKTDDIVQDVVLAKDGRELLVEFVVTHRCDATKVSRIESIDLSAIEIDLSEFPRRGTLGEFAEAILHTSPRIWLFNRHHSSLNSVLEKELETERLENERDLLPVSWTGS